MKHRQSFDIRFYEADRASRLTPVALFNYLQEAAIGHGDATGLDGKALAELGYAWMMNRLHLRIERYPTRREVVQVETWGSNLKGLYAIREWQVTDTDGRTVASATGRWIILDTERKRIIKIPELMAQRYGEHEGRAIDDSFARMEPVEGGGFERRFHVRLSELDTNQHANSACYIDWCLEAVPRDLLDAYLPYSIEITYKKEARLGEGLVARSEEATNDRDTERVFRHTVRKEDGGAVAAIGRSVWRPEAGFNE